MKNFTEYIAEYVINQKIKNTGDYEVWYTYEHGLPSILIKNINDFKQCAEQCKVRTRNQEMTNIIQKMIENNKLILLIPDENSMSYVYCNDKEELEDNQDYICQMDINDFNYDYMLKLKKKYNLK